MRQRPFGIAGDWHRLPCLVRAPQRWLRCMGNLLCMGLILRICAIPTPLGLDSAHHCLATGVHMNVLHRNLLLTLAAMAIERFEQGGVGTGELVSLAQVFAPALKCLLPEH